MRRALAAWLILSSCLPTAVAQKVDANEVLAALRATIQQNTTLEPAARKYVTDHLLSECTNTVFVSGTRLQNERHRSLQEIKALDEQWINTETEIPLQRQVRENECARELLRLLEKKTAVVEAFVMDNQGALVGANQLTSDYWQGDEDKWQQSFAQGRGGLDVGKAAFDRSANAVLQQVSLPILDETGAVIGAVTYGLDLNRVGLATSSFETPAPGNPRLRSLESSICSASGVSPETVTFVCDALLPHCCNPTFVKAVRKQNALEIPLGRIKELDQQWINAEELLPVQQKILQNECAGALRSIVVRHARIREAFVMDNQGALVGANQLTSDYWQGDEAKWQGSFGDGQGGVDVGAAKFDRSANAVLQQISLPILDADGNVLGAVTYGIEVDR